MAHDLEMDANGEACMAFTGPRSAIWHGLGHQIPEGATPEEVMKIAKLDWEVEKRPNFIKTSQGMKKTGSYSLVRSSDESVLTQVGEGWTPVQNKEAFDFFTEFCEAGDMMMETAGSIRNGQYVWAMAKVKEDFTLFNGDRVEANLLFANPHQFGKSIDVKFTPTRVICNNTFTLALSRESNHQIRLTHRSEFNPEMVKEALGLVSAKMAEYKEAAEFLGSKSINDKKFKEFLGKVMGGVTEDGKMTRSTQMVYDLLETQPGAEFAPGTYWSALNAYTHYMDHLQGRSSEIRLANNWFGLARNKKIKAMQTALEMAAA